MFQSVPADSFLESQLRRLPGNRPGIGGWLRLDVENGKLEQREKA
jgi:hypothetical protein